MASNATLRCSVVLACSLLGCRTERTSTPDMATPPATPSAPPTSSSPVDPRSMAGTLEKLCNEGDPAACNNLGSAWAEGTDGVPGVDFAKSNALYEKACEAKNGLGCFNLGQSYRVGEGLKMDLKQALSKFTLSCDLGEAKGCTELGIMYYEGNAVPRDETKAIALLQKACKSGSDVACKNLDTLKKPKH